jgi:hypothetical protein
MYSMLQWKGISVGECSNSPYISLANDNFQNDRYNWNNNIYFYFKDKKIC